MKIIDCKELIGKNYEFIPVRHLYYMEPKNESMKIAAEIYKDIKYPLYFTKHNEGNLLIEEVNKYIEDEDDHIDILYCTDMLTFYLQYNDSFIVSFQGIDDYSGKGIINYEVGIDGIYVIRKGVTKEAIQEVFDWYSQIIQNVIKRMEEEKVYESKAILESNISKTQLIRQLIGVIKEYNHFSVDEFQKILEEKGLSNVELLTLAVTIYGAGAIKQ